MTVYSLSLLAVCCRPFVVRAEPSQSSLLYDEISDLSSPVVSAPCFRAENISKCQLHIERDDGGAEDPERGTEA